MRTSTRILADNLASIHLRDNFGYQRERVIWAAVYKFSRRRDVVFVGILCEEYFGVAGPADFGCGA